jgi:hypothetical protein
MPIERVNPMKTAWGEGREREMVPIVAFRSAKAAMTGGTSGKTVQRAAQSGSSFYGKPTRATRCFRGAKGDKEFFMRLKSPNGATVVPNSRYCRPFRADKSPLALIQGLAPPGY